MEQTITDFFVKAFELILHNRVPSPHPQSSSPSPSTSSSPLKFQLSFDQDPTFHSLLPSQWNSSSEDKLLVVEFFLIHRTKHTKFLIEQWIFDMNEISDSKLEYTIDSITSLYKKLSTLLRSISLLTVTLPVYQKFIKDRNGSIAQSYKLEHSITSTRDLSEWHPSVHNDQEATVYTSPDFVLPGRIFTFRVNYTKSFKFLQKFHETLELNKNKFTIDGFPSNQLLHHPCAPYGECVKDLTLVRKACSDNHFNKDIRGIEANSGDNSPPGNFYLMDHYNQENCGAIFNIPMDLQTRAQKAVIDATHTRVKPRRSFDMRMCENGRCGEKSRLRIKTLESERLAEADVYIYENDEDEFTEVLSWQDMSILHKGSTEPDESGADLDEHDMLRKLSEDYEKNKPRLSNAVRSMEKIVERNEDDMVAELLASIEGLKSLSFKMESGQTLMDHEDVDEGDNADSVNEKKGLRFKPMIDGRRVEERRLNPFEEFNGLKDLYIQIKRQESIS